MRFLPLALGLSFLRSIVAAPTQKQALDLAQVARSVSNSSSSIPGKISIPFKKHRRSKNGQNKSKRADQLGEVHMSEIGNSIYFGILKIASQEFTVQLDTGSSLTIVYGSDFFSSSNTDLTQDTLKANSFDPSQSSTFSFLDNDSVTYNYVADFFRANIAQDTITFGGYELGNTPFALATSGNVSFAGGDGLIGLSFSPLNSIYGQADSSYTLPLVEILWHLNLLSEPLFSFNMFTQSFDPLLGSPPYPPTPGGELLLGGVDESLFEGDIVYSPLVVDASISIDYPSSWKTTVQGVIINGNLLPNSRFDAIFDTGTANSQLPQSILNNLFAEIDTVKYPVYIVSGPFGARYSFECPDDFPQFTYSLIFGNQQFDLAFADLIDSRYSTEEGKVICRLAQSSVADDEPETFIVGDDILRAFYTVYRFAPPSIGIAKLSNKVTNSLDPIPVDLKHISIHTSNPSPISELGLGSATRPVLYTPNLYPTAATFLSTDETLYWDTSTYNLLRQPTFLGTAPIPSPTFTAQATGTSGSGDGGNGDTSGSKAFQHTGLAGVSVAALLGLLLPLLL